MSITKSFNKRTGVYYAYETSYIWDAIKQKKVQKRKCIGRFDPVSNEIVPNGKIGRPVARPKMPSPAETVSEQQQQSVIHINDIAKELLALKQKINTIEKSLGCVRSLLNDVEKLKVDIDRVYNLIE